MRRYAGGTAGLMLCLAWAGCARETVTVEPLPVPTASPTAPLSADQQRRAKIEQVRSVLLGDLRNSLEVMNAMLVLESLETPVVVSENTRANSLTGQTTTTLTERYPAAGLEVVRQGGQVLSVAPLSGPADFSSTRILE